MRLLAALAIAATLVVAAPAAAQSGPGMSDPTTRSLGELSQLSPTHRYWEICRGDDAEAAVRACGRMIGARVSRMHTATAHYFRSVALKSLGQDDRALRDLRRAYYSYVDLLSDETDNTVALRPRPQLDPHGPRSGGPSRDRTRRHRIRRAGGRILRYKRLKRRRSNPWVAAACPWRYFIYKIPPCISPASAAAPPPSSSPSP